MNFRERFNLHCDDVADTAWPRHWFAVERPARPCDPIPYWWVAALLKGLLAMWRHHRPLEPWTKPDREWCSVGVVSR